MLGDFTNDGHILPEINQVTPPPPNLRSHSAKFLNQLKFTPFLEFPNSYLEKNLRL